ncbi:MAG TPA: hypothetical protein O0Y17_03885 [Methanocorpusculum sp.]|nr:hypothetical protein [Methanocorpusculum sp.]
MSKKRLEDYLLLSAITASPAPNPVKMPARGTGVDVCAGGWLIGESLTPPSYLMKVLP